MSATSGPSAKRRALEEEQAHLLAVHVRVDALRRRASARAADAAADRSASTLQGRFERDVVTHHHSARAARYTFGDIESLVFGRLDASDGDALHVGRVSVVDDHQDVLLVDWRAPAAAPFYQATSAEPLAVARRRMLVTAGPRLDDLDDEILDADAAERLGLEAVTGQGALLSALQKHRTGHMRDIVATIQADQDRIIRRPPRGTVIVTGGPGTGKTVVALHRVAYLLYTHRDRFEGRGVLVVGPSDAFTEYISRVLPSLGEDRAVLRPLAGFAPPGFVTDGWDDLTTAAIKGDLRMVEVLRHMVVAALPPLPPETRFTFDGTSAVVRPNDLRRAREKTLQRMLDGKRPYHALRPDAHRAMLGAMWTAWRGQARAQGARLPDDMLTSGFASRVAEAPQVRLAARSFWPTFDAIDLLAKVATGALDLEAAPDVLRPDEAARLRSTWAAAATWTTDDVALIDELRAILGPAPSASADDDDGEPDVGIRLNFGGPDAPEQVVDVDELDYDEFAHVVVDEAQDLSPMQWRMIARRGPYASWTVVGDLAQRSRTAEPRTWQEVAQLIGRRQVEIDRLSVNYRTPVEVVAVARAVLAAAGHDPNEAPVSVRESGEHPVLVRSDDLPETAVARVIDRLRAAAGTAVIVAPREDVGSLRALVAERIAGTPDAVDLDGRVRVLDPRTVKGLEFDDVVIVAPDRIADEAEVGLHQLYVAVTRATRSLTLVAAPGVSVPGEEHLVAP